MVLSKNMLEQVITVFLSDEFMTSVVSNVDVLAGTFNKYLSGMSDLRMASIILMLLALILFLFLIIVLYVKSIIAFLKSDGTSARKKSRKKTAFFDELEENDEDESPINEHDLELELERELERDLEQSRAERLLNEEKELQLQKQAELEKKRDEEKKAREKEKLKEKEKEKEAKASYKKDFQVDLDWKKGKLNEMETEQDAVIPQDKLQYQQSNKDLSELMGLIIDMLGRGVDDLKIAQTVMYRNQGKSSEDEIIQTITAIRDFIALAVNGRFNEVKREKKLPDEATALYYMAEGDTTYSLALIEALMDRNIERTVSMSSGPKRDELFIETSNQACTFGTLSAISDTHLATGAFELAIELVPKNVNAWSRVGDMYKRARSNNQAVWAYQNVLNIADEEINIAQVANANKMLSQYYYEQGDNLQAAKLYNESKQYYDSLGINRRLDRQEIEIVDIIEARRKEDLQETIHKILGSKEFRQYSYA